MSATDSLLSSLQQSVAMNPETTEAQMANSHYFSERQRGVSFDEMKDRLGRECAVAFERLFHGIEELEEQKVEALKQANEIRAALTKDVEPLSDFPKGEGRKTPLEMLIGYPVFNAGDYWWIDVPNSDVVYVAQKLNLDVHDEERNRILTAEQAAYLLQQETAEFEHLGVIVDEALAGFCELWSEGLYPELEA
jgi:hypothetical protein